MGLQNLFGRILVGRMIRAGFLSTVERAELIALARNGLVEHRLARRATALVLLDRGNESLGYRGGAFSRRRYGWDLVPALRGSGDRGAGRVRPRG